MALHHAAAKSGYAPLLEVSTRSDDDLGRQLSAFNLTVRSQRFGEMPLECAFHSRAARFLSGVVHTWICTKPSHEMRSGTSACRSLDGSSGSLSGANSSRLSRRQFSTIGYTSAPSSTSGRLAAYYASMPGSRISNLTLAARSTVRQDLALYSSRSRRVTC